MNLSKREIYNITVTDKNKKFLEKGFRYYFYRGLIFYAIMLILLSIPLITQRASLFDYLVLLVVMFLFYLLVCGMMWGFVSLSVRFGERRIKKLNISRNEYAEIVNKHSKDRLTEMYEQLTKRYQVESLHKLPEFRVPEHPIIYGKIGSWLGWGDLDGNQKKEGRKDRLVFIVAGAILSFFGLLGSGGMSVLTIIAGLVLVVFALFSKNIGQRSGHSLNTDSLTIYKTLLHYWNERFVQVDYRTKRTKDTSFGRQHVFDLADGDKVNIENCYEAPHPVNDELLSDTISYVYKNNRDIFKNGKSNIGILWNLQMPDVKEFDSDISSNFYLLPAGDQSKMYYYNYYTTREGYDIYITRKVLDKELDNVLEFLRPFTERGWKVGVEYTGDYMYIYLPEFLPDIENIASESELLHVCRRVDSFYSFFKRSLVWRYGDIEKWNKSEIKG
ncbi:YgaP family membrane protein [Virgibacillus sediminis]|uniref:DUF2892 domain-containing protein n=1 Tax=Virgibacillus sediminis TaxID=202260 RepID=A0ABV7A1M3_9BACI